MSINACSINEFTINTLCGRRRQAIIDSLRPPVPVIGERGHPQHVNPVTQVPMSIFRRDADRDDDVEITNLEQSHVSVTIQFAGQTFSQILERPSFDPVVTVYGISVSDQIDEQVSITDFRMHVLNA